MNTSSAPYALLKGFFGYCLVLPTGELQFSSDLRSLFGAMDLTPFGWDEGSEEFLTPKALLLGWLPSQDEANAIQGCEVDASGDDCLWMDRYCACFHVCTCHQECLSLFDYVELKAMSPKRLVELCRAQDAVNFAAGQPKLRYAA